VVLNLFNPGDPYPLAWWSLTASEKGLYQDSKELKMDWRVTISQEKLSHRLSIPCIRSDQRVGQILMNSWMILL